MLGLILPYTKGTFFILTTSARNWILEDFIFIIQSDEGPNPCWYLDPCDDEHDLKSSNINAFYASRKLGINEDDLHTPINNFIYIYNYLRRSEVETLKHVVYKRKNMKENVPFNFEVFDDYDTNE